MIAEACVLHYADLMDSQVKNYLQNISDAKKTSMDDWVFVYDADMGKKRPMYLGDEE
jgi:hypothetical protein